METENKVYEFNHVEPTEEQPLQQNEQGDDVKENRTCREKIALFFANITLEPSLLLFIISSMTLMTASQNLNLEKACRVNLNFTDEICDSLRLQDIDSQNLYERETQKLLAKALTWKTYLTATLPCIIALFAGSFSDQTGHRKFFIMISTAGQILVSINNTLNVYFFYQLRLEVLVFSEAILEGITGGWCLCFLTAYAYISTITTDANRTFRMGLMSFSITMAFPIGIGISGIWLKTFGYYGCYGLTTVLHSLNVIYLVCVVRDPERNSDQKKILTSLFEVGARINLGPHYTLAPTTNTLHDRKGVCHLFSQFFKLSNVKNTLSVVLRKAPNNRRLRLSILLAVVSVLFGPMFGEISVMYMSTRYRFGWDEVQYSLFQMFNFVTHTIGTIFSILVFSKYLKWHDSLLGIVSTLSKIAASFVFCFAPNERIFFIAPLVEILNGTSLLSMRTIMTKLVETNELGKVNSLIGLVENLMPLIYVPLYTKVYTSTMEVLPGAVFLLGASMTLPAVIVLIWLFYDHRKQLKKQKMKQTE